MARSDGNGDGRLPLKTRLTVVLLGLVLRLLARTWRFEVRNGEVLRRLRASRTPVMLLLWHGQMMPILWQHRGQGIAILISEHRDGEIIARIAHSLGLRSVRGSTSRGGARALLALSGVLTSGGDVAVTPDGPRGPAGHFAPGALIAAQRGGGAIVTIGAYASRAWRLKSWDRFMIPKPFSRVRIAYRGPVTVPPGSGRLASDRAAEFSAMLDATVADAGA